MKLLKLKIGEENDLHININNAKSGYYLITRFVGRTCMIKEFERTLKLDENVIRYITIALDKKALEYLKKVQKTQSRRKSFRN